MSTLIITTIQPDLHWENKAANLQSLEEKILGIREKTELVILPEMFSTGFSMKPEILAEGMDGPTVNWMKKVAAQKRIILTGSLIIEENGRYYNRLIWMLPNGQLGVYDKRHRFAYAGEHDHYTAGQKRLIASVKGWRVNLQVCYDLRFPVWSRQSPPGEGSESVGFLAEETRQGKTPVSEREEEIPDTDVEPGTRPLNDPPFNGPALDHSSRAPQTPTQTLPKPPPTHSQSGPPTSSIAHPQPGPSASNPPPIPEYDLLIYVANWPERRAHAWKTLLQARAIENQSYTVGVNRVGNDGNNIYHSGDSMIIDPLGEVLYHGSKQEEVFTYTLQKDKLDEVRSRFPFWRDGDRFSIEP